MAKNKDEYRWQVPGNSNPFDVSFKGILDKSTWPSGWDTNARNRNLTTRRTIGIIDYILKHNNLVSYDKYEKDIQKYLYKNWNIPINDSNRKHWYRPLEFVGIIRNDTSNQKLSLSLDGQIFIEHIYNKEYNEAIEFYISQMFKTKYPNTATPDVKLNLFPFRIIFKLMYELKTGIPKNWFLTEIPYIKNLNDLHNIGNLHGLNDNNTKKWISWQMSYLQKFEIVKMEGNYYFLDDKFKSFIISELNNISWEDCFFENKNEVFEKIYKEKARNAKLIQVCIQNSDMKCFLDENHLTFPSKNYSNYLEGHHIIPISLQKNFSNKLDDIKNLIAVCPNCHTALHRATTEYKEQLLDKIMRETNILKDFNLDENDLKEIYL